MKALLTAVLALTPALAMAHPGHHETMTAAQAEQHLFTQPDHLALLAVAAMVVAFGVTRVLARIRVRK